MSERFLRIKFKAGLKEYFQKVIGRLEIDGKKLSLSDMKRIVSDEERLSSRDANKNHTGKPRRNTATPSTFTNSGVECYYCGKKRSIPSENAVGWPQTVKRRYSCHVYRKLLLDQAQRSTK